MLEMTLHRKSKKRRCSRKKCSLKIPLIGICLWSKRVKVKCRRKKRSRR